MAATAKTTAVVVLTLVLVLALAAAAATSKRQTATGKWSHKQCEKYEENDLLDMQRLLKRLEQAPVGERNVTCSLKERRCLARSLLPMGNACARVGSPCDPPWRRPEEECVVRASWSAWRRERRLVGECACALRCDASSLPVRVSPDDALGCAQAGHMLCACGRRPPPRRFPFEDCECRTAVALQPALFGGFECANLCEGSCSPQRGRRACVFPVL